MQLVPDPSTQPIAVPPRPVYVPVTRAGWFRRALPLLAGLLVMIILRSLWLDGDPTEFPTDRNFSTLRRIQALQAGESADAISIDYGATSLTLRQLTPELPIIAVGGWLLRPLTGNPLTAARLTQLVFAVLTGIGLYLLGARLAGTLAGALALLFFAVAPLGIFLGRSLLPDGPALAFLVWALWAAVAADPRRPWRCALSVGLFAIGAALAKLTIAFFLPLVFLCALGQLGPRRVRSWWVLALAGGALLAAVVLWYRIKPWALGDELREMSRHTNHLLDWSVMPPDSIARLLPWRLVLAWTLPGALLVLVGGALAAGRPGLRLPAAGWLVLAVVFMLVALRANSYWAVMALPVGALLAGLALASLWKTAPVAAVALVVLLAPVAWLDPALSRLEQYMTNRPLLIANAQALRDRLPEPGEVLYLDQVPFAMQWYTGRAGRYPQDQADPRWLGEVQAGRYAYIHAAQGGGALVSTLFNTRAVVAQDGGGITFAGRGGVGKPLSPGPLPARFVPLVAEFTGQLRVLGVAADPRPVSRGEVLELELALERLPALELGNRPRLSLNFIQLSSKDQMYVTPEAGGGIVAPTPVPVIQLPDFSQGDRSVVRVSYRISPHLPAGEYGIRLRWLDPQSSVELADATLNSRLFTITVPEVYGPLPQRLGTTQLLVHQALLLQHFSPWGHRQPYWRMNGNSDLRFRPNLPAGHYELRLLLAATPAGTGPESWPVLVIRQPWLWREQVVHNLRPQWITLPLEWHGADDVIQCYIKNPASRWPGGTFPPLNYDDIEWNERTVNVERIEVHPLGTAPAS